MCGQIRPGWFYVSAVSGRRYWCLSGPYASKQNAQNNVDRIRQIVCKNNCWFDVCSFGVYRIDDDGTPHWLLPIGLVEKHNLFDAEG